jgi:hypothetical protein
MERPGIPVAVERVVDRAMRSDARTGYGSIGALAAAIEAIPQHADPLAPLLRLEALDAPPPSEPQRPPDTPGARRPDAMSLGPGELEDLIASLHAHGEHGKRLHHTPLLPPLPTTRNVRVPVPAPASSARRVRACSGVLEVPAPRLPPTATPTPRRRRRAVVAATARIAGLALLTSAAATLAFSGALDEVERVLAVWSASD